MGLPRKWRILDAERKSPICGVRINHVAIRRLRIFACLVRLAPRLDLGHGCGWRVVAENVGPLLGLTRGAWRHW